MPEKEHPYIHLGKKNLEEKFRSTVAEEAMIISDTRCYVLVLFYDSETCTVEEIEMFNSMVTVYDILDLYPQEKVGRRSNGVVPDKIAALKEKGHRPALAAVFVGSGLKYKRYDSTNLNPNDFPPIPETDILSESPVHRKPKVSLRTITTLLGGALRSLAQTLRSVIQKTKIS